MNLINLPLNKLNFFIGTLLFIRMKNIDNAIRICR